MRIGVDVRCLMVKNYSGVSWYTYNLLKNLFDLDRDNQYVLFYNSSQPVDWPQFDGDNITYAGFNYSNKLFNTALAFGNHPKLDKLIGGVDVMLIPNLNFVAWSGECRKIAVVHDLSFIRYPNFFTLKQRLWHKLVMRKKLLAKSDVIIAVSDNTKRDLMELLDLPAEKIKVVYEGVDPKFRVLADGDGELTRVRDKYDLPEKFILYLGTLEPRKNVASVIEAHNRLKPDCQLVIGGGTGWKSEEIKKMAEKNPRVSPLGYVAEADKVALYNLASLFVYPSYYEGFGLPPLEAMACGTPVIVGANSSQVEAIGGDGILVDPYNVNEIAEAMRVVLADDNLRNDFIGRGLERAKRFDWRDTAEEVLDIINKNIG